MISLDKDNIPLENYSKSLSVNQEKFLMSSDFRGMSSKNDTKQNPTDIRKNIMHNLQNSMKSIHQIMKHTKNLKESEIYEVFNAVNLKSFFGSLLRDTKLNSRETLKGYKYDFRTSENARMMLEASLNYLLYSPEFRDRKNTIENAKQISEDFKLLSRSNLSKEHEKIMMKLSKQEIENHSDKQDEIWKESENIQDKLDGIIMKVVSITNLPDSFDYKVIGDALEQTREIILLKLTRINIELSNSKNISKKNIIINKEYKPLVQELEDIEEGIKLIEKLVQNENKTIELEKGLYKEIINYFSPLNPIKNNSEYESLKIETIGDLYHEFH